MKEKNYCVEVEFTLVKYFELGAKNNGDAKEKAIRMGGKYKRVLHQTIEGVVVKTKIGKIVSD